MGVASERLGIRDIVQVGELLVGELIVVEPFIAVEIFAEVVVDCSDGRGGAVVGEELCRRVAGFVGALRSIQGLGREDLLEFDKEAAVAEGVEEIDQPLSTVVETVSEDRSLHGKVIVVGGRIHFDECNFLSFLPVVGAEEEGSHLIVGEADGSEDCLVKIEERGFGVDGDLACEIVYFVREQEKAVNHP